MSNKATLEAELADLAGKLARAEKLVAGLAGERHQWQASIGALEARVAALPGDVAVAAAFLSYAGPFPSEYRDELARATWLPQVRGTRAAGLCRCLAGLQGTHALLMGPMLMRVGS